VVEDLTITEQAWLIKPDQFGFCNDPANANREVQRGIELVACLDALAEVTCPAGVTDLDCYRYFVEQADQNSRIKVGRDTALAVVPTGSRLVWLYQATNTSGKDLNSPAIYDSAFAEPPSDQSTGGDPVCGPADLATEDLWPAGQTITCAWQAKVGQQ
jgi:hypothetical protein